MKLFCVLLALVALVGHVHAGLFGFGFNNQIGRGSETYEVNGDTLGLGTKSVARVVACVQNNLIITTDGSLLLSGAIGPTNIQFQVSNFTPPSLDGRVVLDAACTASMGFAYTQTEYIISTDDNRVFTFASGIFNYVYPGPKLLLSGDVAELEAPNDVVGTPIRHVRAGGQAFAVVFENGIALAWGSNAEGKLGRDSNTESEVASGSPLVIVDATSTVLISDVSLGTSHTLVCSYSGSVWASGNNAYGQLMDGTTTSREFFAQWSPLVVRGEKCLRVFATSQNSFVLSTLGAVYTAGNDVDGQRGDGMGPVLDINSDVFYLSIPNLRVTELAVGDTATGAYVLASGYDSRAQARRIYGWGSIQAASMAGVSGRPLTSPTELIYLTADLKGRIPLRLSATGEHAAIQIDGGFITWSATFTPATNVWGGYRRGLRVDIRNRIENNEDFVILASCAQATGAATYGVLRTGEVYRWGRFVPDPIQLLYPGSNPIVQVSVGADYALFLSSNGSMFGHGSNRLGQITNPRLFSQADDLAPIEYDGVIVSVAATTSLSLAVNNQGKLLYWGTVPQGSWIGISSDAPVSAPTEFPLSDVFAGVGFVPSFAAVYSGPEPNLRDIGITIYLRATNDKLYSFGANKYGELCSNTSHTTTFSGTASQISLPSWVTSPEVSVGGNFAAIRSGNGTVLVCGYNGVGYFEELPPFVDSCYLPCQNVTSDIVIPTPRPLKFRSDRVQASFTKISAGLSNIVGQTADGEIRVVSSAGFWDPFYNAEYVTTRRISAFAASDQSAFVFAGPLELRVDLTQIPVGATELRFYGRGFGYVNPAAPEIQVTLSEGACSVTTVTLNFTVLSDSYFTCIFTATSRLTLGSNLTASVSVLGEQHPLILVGQVVPNPTLNLTRGNSDPIFYSFGGFRTLSIPGNNFGNRRDHVEVSIRFSYSAETDSTSCLVASVTDTLITCDVFVPVTQAPIFVRVKRLSAPSAAFHELLASTVEPWSLISTELFKVPSNARAVLARGTGALAFPSMQNTMRWALRPAGSTFTNMTWFPCSPGSGTFLTTSAESVARCGLGRDLSAFPTDRSLEIIMGLFRGGYEEFAVVGVISGPFSLTGRASSAKVAQRSKYFFIPFPVEVADAASELAQDRTVSFQLDVVPSASGATKRAINGNTTSTTCSVVNVANGTITCFSSVSNNFAAGNLYANMTVPAFGLQLSAFLGEIVESPSVDVSLSKFVIQQGAILNITGSNFATGPFALTENSVSFIYGGGGTGISPLESRKDCRIIEASSTRLSCNVSAAFFINYGDNLRAVVTTYGESTDPTVVATSVNIAQFFFIGGRVDLFDPVVKMNGSNFADDPSKALVRFYIGGENTERAYEPCVIDLRQSNSTYLVCTIPDANIVSVEGRRLWFSVFSNGAWSRDTEVVVDPSRERERITTIGASVGIILAIIVIAGVIVLIVILLRRQTRIKDIKSSLTAVPAQMAGMFNIKSADLEITKKLGEGSFGAVFLAKFKSKSGIKDVAVKKLTSSMLASNVDSFFREASVMMSIAPNKNVVRIWGLCQELNNFSLVMEYLAKGSLDKYALAVTQNGSWKKEELYRIVIGIARGMAHLAEAGIVHRDLAARNILLSKKSEPKVSDFGMSRVLNSEEASGQTNSNVGPIRWMSPENIRDRVFSEKSDVWAFGVLLYELLTGSEPYAGEDLLEVAVSIRDRARNPVSSIPRDIKIPKYILQVMELCFEVDPADRPTFAEIAEKLAAGKPSGYRSESDENEEPILGVDASRRKSKAKDGKKKKVKTSSDIEVDNAVELAPIDSASGKYGPITGSLGETPDSSPSSSKEKKPEAPTPHYGPIDS